MTTKSEMERVVEIEAAQVRAETLYQISRDLNMARDEEELLKVLARPAREAGINRATLWYIDLDQAGEPEWLRLVAHWEQKGELHEQVGARYYVPEFRLADLWLSSTDGLLLIADTSTDARLDETAKKIYAEANTSASVIIPMTQGGHRVGLFTFNWTETHEFDEQETAIYCALVDLAAPAVAAHRMAQDARAKAKEQTVLNELSRALTARLTVEEVLEEVYRQTSRLLDTTNFYVGLYNADRHEIVFPFNISDSQVDREIVVMPADEGLTGYIVHNRKSLLFRDNVKEHERTLGVATVGVEAQSWLGVPMVIGDRVLGVIAVQSYTTPRLYGEREQELLLTIASQAAIALQNARLFEETHNRAKRLAAVNRIAKTVSTTFDLDGLAEMICQEVMSTFQADAFFISLYDQATNQVDVRLMVDEGIRATPGRGSLGGLTAIVVNEKKPLIIRNAQELDSLLPVARLTGTGKAPESWLGSPMMIGERVIGIISVQAYRSYAWDEEDEELLFTITDQVAVAIENARLFQERERRVAELSIVNEIGQMVSFALEMDELLALVHQQISRLFEAEDFYIATYKEGKEEWCVAFWMDGGELKSFGEARKLGTGLTSHILRTRQPLLFHRGEDILAFHDSQGIESVGEVSKSWLGVPLIAADKIVGVMAIQSYTQENLYTEQDLSLFSTIAAQVATSLDNMRLLEQSRRRAQEMTVLNELGRALTTQLAVKEVLEETYQGTSRLLDTTNFYIVLYNAEKHELAFAISVSELEDEGYPDAFSADTGLSGYIVRNRTPLLLEDNLDERMEEMGIPVIGTQAFSWLGVPLIVGDRVLGVMAVQSYTTPRLYGEHERDLLAAVANQASIALQNARMVETLEQRIENRTAELRQSLKEREQLQQEIIDAQKQALKELSTPIIPIMKHIIVMPLIGSIDTMRARDVTRNLLAGIRQHQAKVVILDITGVPIVDSGVAGYLNRTIQAARLKGAHAIVTGISEAVAETIVDLGIDWSGIETLPDLQTGLRVALTKMGRRGVG